MGCVNALDKDWTRTLNCAIGKAPSPARDGLRGNQWTISNKPTSLGWEGRAVLVRRPTIK